MLDTKLFAKTTVACEFHDNMLKSLTIWFCHRIVSNVYIFSCLTLENYVRVFAMDLGYTEEIMVILIDRL